MIKKSSELVIIGGGPAGLTAAIYSSRAGFDTLVLDKTDGLLEKVEKIENYFGFTDAISGKEILERGRKQAEKFGAEIIKEEALSIKLKNDNYLVETAEEKYRSKGLILAPGIKHETPSVENLKKFEGQGVSYCVTCDAPFFRDKKVGLLGSKDYAAKEALELSEFTENITIFTNGKNLEVSEELEKRIEEKSIPIINSKVRKVTGDDNFRGLALEDEEVSLDGLFIAVGTSGSTDFARSLGIPVEGDTILVEEDLSAGPPRIYAAGDCTGGPRQISIAVGEGAEAALNLVEELRGEKYKDW